MNRCVEQQHEKSVGSTDSWGGNSCNTFADIKSYADAFFLENFLISHSLRSNKQNKNDN